ncbi:MAG: hypothetical protein IJ463_03290 [Bacilli bacterium]|nr:hypothetical protein [Bacilli bacterium]
MEHGVITQENLIAIYNICKKRLTISQDDFLNNPKYEKIKETTLKRYDAVNKFISSIMNTRRFEIFKENVCVEFGNDNFTDDNIYAYFVDRIEELKKMYGDVELNTLYGYCLKDKKLRIKEIKNCELIKKDSKRVKLNGLYDYLIKDSNINRERFLNLNDPYYEFERVLLLTIDNNLDRMRGSIAKLDDEVKGKFINDIKNKYHLVEVNGHYVCRYLFDNFRMVKVLRNNVGYRRLLPNNFMDIFKCSLNVNNVKLAFDYVCREDSKLIKDAYIELKDNKYFRDLVNFPKDNLGITFSIIKLLGNSLIEVNELNNYLGFMRRISLSKYVLMDKYTKKNYMKNALTLYKKKILRGTRESAIKFIENISIYDNLRIEEKAIITSNYKRFIDEIFNLAIATCDDLDFNLIEELVKYVSVKVIEIIMIESQDEALSVNRVEFVKGDHEDAKSYVESYKLFVAKEETKKVTDKYDSMLKEQEENTLRLRDLTTAFHKDLDEIFTKYNEVERDRYIAELTNSDEIQREERMKVWKEQLLAQYRNKHSDNSYEFFSALYDLLAIYERKTGRKYDPKRCLFSFDDVYRFYYLDDEQRNQYEKELIIDENFFD